MAAQRKLNAVFFLTRRHLCRGILKKYGDKENPAPFQQAFHISRARRKKMAAEMNEMQTSRLSCEID
jgi:hypothetical protein